MNTEVLLILVTLVGSINAFFIKGLINSIDKVRISLVEVVTDHKNTSKSVDEIKVDVEKLIDRVHAIELQRKPQK